MNKINVLSLFDGMSCGQLAINQLGFEYNYYASEIDKHAMQVTQSNFPNTVQLGSVEHWQLWDIDFASIDLLIGGSPCQGFSFAGKQLNFEDPRSKLFFVYVDILNYIRSVNPNVKFLLENVKMKKEYEAVISEHLGVKSIEINSNLVSAQNRKRLYWTNIEGVTQPEDRGVYLKDILQEEVDEKYYLSEAAINRSLRKEYSKPQIDPDKTGTLNTKNNSGQCSFDSGTTFIKVDKSLNKKPNQEKASCFTAGGNSGGNHSDMDLICVAQRGRETLCLSPKRTEYGKQIRKDYEAGLITEQRKNIQQLEPRNDGKHGTCLSKGISTTGVVLQIKEATAKGYAEINPGECFDHEQPNSKTRRGRRMSDKSNSLMAQNMSFLRFTEGCKIRRLTPIECERLQTVPDNYTASASDTQRYRMLGNGWTVEVIKHILKNLKA